MSRRLKGEALRKHVKRTQACAFFPRWRARVEARVAVDASRSRLQRVYFIRREQGMRAWDAYQAALDAIEFEAFGGFALRQEDAEAAYARARVMPL